MLRGVKVLKQCLSHSIGLNLHGTFWRERKLATEYVHMASVPPVRSLGAYLGVQWVVGGGTLEGYCNSGIRND